MPETKADSASPDIQENCNSLRWTWAIWVVFALILAFQPNYAWDNGVRSAPYGSDFLQEWIGGHIVLSGKTERLYDWDYSTQLQHDPDVVGYKRTGDGFYPMVYPPYWYVACAPLAAIPLKWAAPIWLGFLTAIWFFGLRWAIGSDTRLGRAISRAPQLAVICGPVLLCYGLGQKSGLVTLAILATALLVEQKRYRTAGIVFGLLAFKPHFALLLGIPLALRFGLPFVTGALASLVAWIGLTYAVDPAMLGEYIYVAVENSARDYSSHAGYRFDDAHNMSGFWNRLLGVGESSHQIATVWSLAAIAVTVVVAVRRYGQRISTAEWTVFICGLVLASPHFYGYDLAILIVPVYWLLRDFDERPQLAIGLGAALWYGLTVLPHMSKGDLVPIQWSALIVIVVFTAATVAVFGLRLPVLQRQRRTLATVNA